MQRSIQNIRNQKTRIQICMNERKCEYEKCYGHYRKSTTSGTQSSGFWGEGFDFDFVLRNYLQLWHFLRTSWNGECIQFA